MRYSNKITDGNNTCNGNINDQGITKSNANDENSNFNDTRGGDGNKITIGNNSCDGNINVHCPGPRE